MMIKSRLQVSISLAKAVFAGKIFSTFRQNGPKMAILVERDQKFKFWFWNFDKAHSYIDMSFDAFCLKISMDIFTVDD